MKKKFAGILAGAIAGSTAFCATQAIATQETNMQPVDQYWIIDLEAIEWETPEVSSASELEEGTDVSEPAQATYLNETGLLETKNQQDMIYARDYAVKGVRMDEAIISYLLDGYDAYADYGAIDICDVTYLQPADENGLFKLFFQKEDGASVIHYSLDAEGLLQKSIEDTDFVSADGYDSKTNHWLIVHLTPEVVTEETPAASQTSAEGDQTASESLDGKVDSEPENDPTKASQDVAKVPESTKEPGTKPAPTTPAQTTAPSTTATPTTTAPTTTAHTHNWVAVTKTVHHDAVTSQVWKEDTAAWDETVVTKAAWEEQVLSQAAYDEPVYDMQEVCNVCGYVYPLDVDFNDAYYYHAVVDPGDGGGYYMVQVQTGTVHHDAVYTTVHHDAETTVVHHDATGHYETVVTQAAWDETVTTGYKCSGCGATK